MTPMLRQALAAFALLLALTVMQIAVMPLIAVSGAVPSLLLIGTVFISLRQGQLTAMLVSFPAGILADAYASGLVGLTSLGLVITAFGAGFFHDEEKAALFIRGPRAVAVLAPAALVFHAVYVFAYFQTLDIRLVPALLTHVLGASVYTTVLSVIPVLIMARRTPRLKV